MGPETHALLSACDTGFWRKHTWPVVLAGLAGATVSDIPYVLQVALYTLSGKSFSGQFSAILGTATMAAHMIILWMALYVIIAYWPSSWGYGTTGYYAGLAFARGGLLWHIPVDMLTHGHGERFCGPNYLFPLPGGLEFCRSIGICNYVRPGTRFVPEWFEVAADFALVILLLWQHYDKRRRRAMAKTELLRLSAQADC